MSSSVISKLVSQLNLTPHPEGGWYRETFRSHGKFEGEGEFPEGRNFFTSIYFLISGDNFSALHRIRSDESWHFYSGDPLEIVEIDTEGSLRSVILGPNIENGQQLQYTVPAGNWFGSRVLRGGQYSLVGCTVAPGFDFRDFEMAGRDQMISMYPAHEAVITQMTRK